MKCFLLIVAALLMIELSACSKRADNASVSGSVTNTNTPEFYLVQGLVKKVEPEAKKITIQHDEIPHYMPAMTMPFNVKDLAEIEGIQAGDKVFFVLRVTPTESWVEKFKKVPAPGGASSNAPAPPQASAPAEREPIRLARDVDPLNVGDAMPNYRFTNELGRAVSLSDFKGDALAFTFIYTRCPLPDYCPRMSRNFSEVCQKLKALPNGPTNWHLLSISFDPHYDTPAVMRTYAQVFQNYDSNRWNFVTGAMIDIDAITDQFNLPIIKQGVEWDHKIRTVVVDANGRIQNIIIGNQWTPGALVEEMVKAARPTPSV